MYAVPSASFGAFVGGSIGIITSGPGIEVDNNSFLSESSESSESGAGHSISEGEFRSDSFDIVDSNTNLGSDSAAIGDSIETGLQGGLDDAAAAVFDGLADVGLIVVEAAL